jgi:glycosyltransferase involved in cell wall biosynthesis
VFGYLHAAQRLPHLLDVFRAQQCENCYLYLAGPIGGLTPPAVRELAKDPDAARQAHVLMATGYLPYERVYLAMHAIDVGINLRFPTTGETSATLCSLLSMGKPVIVSAVGSFCEFPDECVVKIPVDETEPAHLGDAIRRLAKYPSSRSAMGRAARAYSQCHTWEHTAQNYMDFLWQIITMSSPPMAR